jgi:hypothetical protein
VGWSRQPMMLSSVVLPEPDAPTMATHSPPYTSSSTSRSATTGAVAPYFRPTRSSLTIGAVAKSATAARIALQADDDEVAGGEVTLKRGHADVAVRRKARLDRHEVQLLAGSRLYPGPTVGRE